MYIVALTGGIGSGKSTVGQYFHQLGVNTFDADDIARLVVAPGQAALEAITEHFGQHILNPTGELDRAKLRRIVFDEPKEKAWLEALLHPLIREQTQASLQAATSPYAIWIVPLLIETNQSDQADRVLVVDVKESTQLERALARDADSTAQTIQKIIDQQAKREARLAHATDVIDNEQAPEVVIEQVKQLHQEYLQAAAQKEAKTRSNR